MQDKFIVTSHTNHPYFPKPAVAVATLTKDVYIPPRSKTLVKIKCAKNNLQVLTVDISDAKQIYCNEILLEHKEGRAKIYITNVS